MRVVENPIINRIAFEGNNKLADKDLTTEIQLRPRVVYTRTRVQNDVKRVLDLYRRRGYFAATVEPKVIQLSENRVDLVFEINEGSATGVRSINFVGNRQFSDGDSARRDRDQGEPLVPFPLDQRQLRPRSSDLRPRAAAQVLSVGRLRRLPGGFGASPS